jgi:hypothetical protein
MRHPDKWRRRPLVRRLSFFNQLCRANRWLHRGKCRFSVGWNKHSAVPAIVSQTRLDCRNCAVLVPAYGLREIDSVTSPVSKTHFLSSQIPR